MQHDTYVTATLSICTRYYCDLHVIDISNSNSIPSSLSYDTYKPNIPHHVPCHNQRVRGGDSQGHPGGLSWEEAGFHQLRSASGG